MLYPVVLTGGSGTRLWPLSRRTLPKQLLPLTSQHSMLQETLLRLRDLEAVGSASIVCNQAHRFLVAEQLREIDITPQLLMLEPVGRSTAPALAAAALHLQQQDPDALMLVLPADHVIADVPAFYAAIAKAMRVARHGYLAAFGVVPHVPSTSYGYIQRGAIVEDGHGAFSYRAYEVSRFVERPDAATAQQYLEAGDYYWNSGMFLFSVRRLLEELEKFQPEMLAACRTAVERGFNDLDFYRLDEESFVQCPALSIDHAVMEKTGCASVVPVDIGWHDVGSWSALWEHLDKDESGNVLRGEVVTHEVRNCYINAERHLVAAVGVDDLIIVETADAVLVMPKDQAHSVKEVVHRLKAEGRTEHEIHRKVYRPWGSTEGMDRGERFQVKRIVANPGATLSLQRHHHRSEHWVVVSGTAQVTIDDEVRLLGENQSIYIPLGASHRLHNPGRIPLHLIEVQSGSYLSEDDIVRTDDVYRSAVNGEPDKNDNV